MENTVKILWVFLVSALSFTGAEILFREEFEDTDFSSRGWYDSPRADLSTVEHIPGSGSSFECYFQQGERGCRGGTPGRMPFAESETVHLSYWVKYSANYIGSNRPYHPHEFHFITNRDDRWVGPAHTRLTTYTEQVGGVVRIALQDSRNNDPGCILLNNDSFVGCNGDFNSYPFTENRSVCACNGLAGDLDGRDCFNRGDGTYYSARFWDSKEKMFKEEAGPYYKNDWHYIECSFRLNSIAGGSGIPDGVIQYWYDGELIIDHRRILFRTGAHPDMRFNQFLIAPYIGDGSPVDQYMWVDNLTVSTSRTGSGVTPNSGLIDNNISIRAVSGGGIEIAADVKGPQVFNIKIRDLTGRNVWNSGLKYKETDSVIRISPNLSNGLYFLTVNTAGRRFDRRCIYLN